MDNKESQLKLIGKLLIILGAVGIPISIISANTISIVNYNEFFGALHHFSIGFIQLEKPLRILFIVPILYSVISVLFLTSGFGLIYQKKWARKLVLIPAFVMLFNFPVGTAIGIYIIYLIEMEPRKAHELVNKHE